MSETKSLSIDVLVLDADTQSRLSIHDETVEAYAELIERQLEWPFPPVDVFEEGSRYLVADGFHRVMGAKKTKRASIPCTVYKGTATDARIFAMTANDEHGLRMTRADKRACVEWLLDNPPRRNQQEVADIAGVSRRLVTIIVADRKIANAHNAHLGEEGRTELDGTEPTEETSPSEPRSGTELAGEDDGQEFVEMDYDAPTKPPPAKVGEKCPNCLGTKWRDGACVKCNQPEGEPAGEVDSDRIKTQRAKTINTVDALMRALDDLQMLCPNSNHENSILTCKALREFVGGWK